MPICRDKVLPFASSSKHNQQSPKLPPCRFTHKPRRFQFDSKEVNNKSLIRINDLVKKRIQAQELVMSPKAQNTNLSIFQRVHLWRLKLNFEADDISLRSKKRSKLWCLKTSTQNVEDADDTDLDKAFHEYTIKHEESKSAKHKEISACPRQMPLTVVSMEGQLLKFTNLMSGYQYRWFVLNTAAGTLEYFEHKDHKRQKPRGVISLWAAKVSQSESDPQSFTVSSENRKIFKLKARDLKERNLWVQRICALADHKTGKYAKPSFCSPQAIIANMCTCMRKPPTSSASSTVMKLYVKSNSIKAAKDYYWEAENYSRHLDNTLMEITLSELNTNSLDRDLLLFKATTAATLLGIHECINILELAHTQLTQCVSTTSSMVIKPSSLPLVTSNILDDTVISLPDPNEEVLDDTPQDQKLSDKLDEHRSVVLHLLSQMKPGMDLTKVVLPTFILERRSLLELFTDCMAHPNTFVNIPKISDPEKRFLATLEWYLTSFHSGRLGTSAKKPYNPIIGETFHCSWHIPNPRPKSKDILLTYTAEQVSHHPPVSAFYVECPEYHMKMNASIYTKSKFTGMSISVSLIGKLCLRLEDLREDYIFSMPSAYARSIFTVPWVELGDKLFLTCEQTGYMATIIFHTKPFFGGKLHHLTAEVKNVKTGDIICKVVGEWNNILDFTYIEKGNKQKKGTHKENSKTVDVKTLTVFRKYIRPLAKQKEYESRKLWFDVTTALNANDIQKATEYKQKLEAIQRENAERQRQLKIEYEGKFFRKVDGVWLYKPLPDNFVKTAKK